MDISEEEYKDLFIVKKYLGEGSFGNVFMVKHKVNGRKYAVKRILLPHDKELQKMVWREKDILDKVAHQNVIQSFYFTTVKEGIDGKNCKFPVYSLKVYNHLCLSI